MTEEATWRVYALDSMTHLSTLSPDWCFCRRAAVRQQRLGSSYHSSHAPFFVSVDTPNLLRPPLVDGPLNATASLMRAARFSRLLLFAWGWLVASAQPVRVALGHRASRARRRAESASAPLVQGYGTHFAYLWVGTPPQRVSVIVDTGSSITAFPCTGCAGCGSHTDPYFQLTSSASLTEFHCAQGRDCDLAVEQVRCAHGQCVLGQRYAEGSSWAAQQVRDVVWIGAEEGAEANANLAINFTFACQTSETGLFISQLADGIMGMMRRGSNLAIQLKDQGKIDAKGFSLCFRSGGGFMTLGGTDASHHVTPMQYASDRIENGWYTVQVLEIRVGGAKVEIGNEVYNEGKGIIVDSGTTDTYLPRKCAAHFEKAWLEATGSTYSVRMLRLSEDEMLQLPVVSFTLQGAAGGPGVVVEMAPEDYMEAQTESTYVSRLYLNEPMGGVLGANFMRNHDVHFDLDNGRVGFAKSACIQPE
eukprot:scaffold1396_cov252-Pinguiococcus_pyrenoidosus.AAC.12